MLKVERAAALSGTTAIIMVVGLAMLIGKIYLMFWVSDLFYGWGWWPIGALLRLVAWIEILGVVAGTLFLVIGVIGVSIVLVASWVRRKTS
jgi:hypothetical protein